MYDASMDVIYIDRLFVLNLLIDYLLLLLSARVSGLVLRRRRYLLGALAGAAYAVLVLLPNLRFLGSLPGALAAAVLMALIAYGGEAHFLRCGSVFLAVSAAFGGAIWALSMAGGYPRLDLRVLLPAFAFCYAGVKLLFRARGKLPDQPRAEVCLSLAGRSCRFMALLDSGNQLCDPVSGAAVMLACPHALAPLFPGANLAADPVELLRASPGGARFRLIPYRVVGAQGLLAVFRPERLTVGGQERKELLVGISPSAQGDGYEAIV